MKRFFTSFLGAFSALILFFCGGAFMIFMFFGVAAVMSSRSVPKVESGSYLVIDLTAALTDSPAPWQGLAALSRLAGEDAEGTLQLRQVVRALDAAAADDRIRGLVLKGNLLPVRLGSGYGALGELRRALTRFRESGKPVTAYIHAATTRDFYVLSAADDVVLDPYGVIWMPGLAAQPLFFAEALEKVGVGVQVVQVGDFKSAAEMFLRRDLSPENRLQLEELLHDMWDGILDTMASSRGMTGARLQELIDGKGLFRPELAMETGLVDRVVSLPDLLAELKDSTGQTGTDPFTQVSLGRYLTELDPRQRGKSRGAAIAVIYAEGALVDGSGKSGDVGGDRFARKLRQLRQDDDVKAIVLRVNSPGGSASASEFIQRELLAADADKPVVVSLGSYATSGGYWIATAGRRIFTEPATITGSIGVIGMFFNVKELAGRVGVGVDTVKTGEFADALTVTRPKTRAEMALWEQYLDWIYGEFIDRVARSREMDRDRVRELAGGRVWSGRQALDLGLADEFGGLNDAVAWAAREARMGARFRVIEYPASRTFMERIFEALGGAAARTVIPGDPAILKPFRDSIEMLRHFNDPKHAYALPPVRFSIDP